ncbi:MAG: MlaD family protein [Bacteroidales bacterium]|jgi:phospholipid/cholesterol/gamma-HCH transport system substrate-binding protein|nr:MlaD family protein [Bacteroidales bacterium]
MKITREAKIGVTVLVTIALFIWMYNFLKGENILTRTSHYYVVYDEISGLTESNPVEVSGYKVGVVQSIRFIDDGSGRLLVTLSLDKKMGIPVGSFAEVTAASLIAGMKIQFVFSDSREIYENGDTIPGRLAESLLTKLEVELMPLKETISGTIIRLDSVIASINMMLTADFRNNVEGTVASLNDMTGSMSTVISEREKELSATIANLHSFSEVLAGNGTKLDKAMSNLATITDSLASADLAGTIDRLRDAAQQSSELLESINKGEGSAGKLFSDDSLYINLSESLENLSMLLEDLRENPKRYVHFSVFGKK